MTYNSNVSFDESIQEWVGVDLDGWEHFGQTARECRSRISEANRVLAEHSPVAWDAEHVALVTEPYSPEFTTAQCLMIPPVDCETTQVALVETNRDIVGAQMACPKCGENREDWLITDGEDVECMTCGYQYNLIDELLEFVFDGDEFHSMERSMIAHITSLQPHRLIAAMRLFNKED